MHTVCAIAGMALLASALVGCHGHSSSSQVVAEVNGRELTISELNQTLQSLASSTPSAQADIEEALQNLVDQELMAQAAIEEKLDQDASVREKLAAVRRSMLASSLQQRVVFSNMQFNDQQLHAFYDEHPELFHERRIYHTIEFQTAGHPLAREMLDQVRQSQGVTQVRTLLGQTDYLSRETDSLSAAEEIPSDVLSKLFNAKVGDVSVEVALDGSATIVCLVDALNAPVSFEQSRQAIGHYLNGKKKREDLHQYLDALRKTAKIEYSKGATSVN